MTGHEYLKNVRKIEDAAGKFNIGVCKPDGSTEFPRGTSITDKVYEQLSSFYLDDRFKDSVLFPIFDMYGSLIGISAKLLGDNRQAKYINTVYPKGEHLYGFNVTKRACFDARKVYVVEGNFDVLQMYQKGIHNVVGMLGSSFSVIQLTLLARFVDEVVFVPDGDKAGNKFLARMFESNDGATPITKKQPNLDLKFKIVKLPEGEDPDTFLCKFGKSEFLKLESEYSPTLKELYTKLGGKA